MGLTVAENLILSADCYGMAAGSRLQKGVSPIFGTGGLVQVSHFSLLPDIGAGAAAAAVLASMIPLLVFIWRRPDPACFACCAALASLNRWASYWDWLLWYLHCTVQMSPAQLYGYSTTGYAVYHQICLSSQMSGSRREAVMSLQIIC